LKISCFLCCFIGTDVNFGAITRGMVKHLQTCDNVEVNLGYNINDITKKGNQWELEVEDLDVDDIQLISRSDQLINCSDLYIKDLPAYNKSEKNNDQLEFGCDPSLM